MSRARQIEAEAHARDCVESLAVCTRWLWNALHPGRQIVWRRHHDLICVVMQQLAAALDDVHESFAITGIGATHRPTKFAFAGPPGIGKTLPLNRVAPCWRWLRHPQEKVLFGQHSIDDAGVPLQMDRREILTSAEYRWVQFHGGAGLPAWRIKTAAKRTLETDHGGAFMLTSTKRIAGKGQGTHAHWHQIDDAHQPADMGSPATMRMVRQIATEMLPGRFEGPQVMLVNAQRLGAGDIHDILDERYPDMIRVSVPRAFDPDRYALPAQDPYHLPAVVDLGPPAPLFERVLVDEDPHWRGYAADLKRAGISVEGGRLLWRDPRSTPGELLDDPGYTAEQHANDKASAPFFYATQQQQAGVSRGDSIIDDAWWDTAELWSSLPQRPPHELVITCDGQAGAPSRRKAPDRTAIQVQARWWDHVSVIERVKATMDTTEAARVIWRLVQRHPGATVVVEDGGAGGAIVDLLRYHVPRVELEKPRGTTAGRLEASAWMVEAGQVHLPSPAAKRPPWLPEAEPWPVRSFADIDGLPPQLTPAQPRTEHTTTEAPRDWVPDFRQEVGDVKHGGSGFDDDADALTIGLRHVRPRLTPKPPEGAPPATSRFLAGTSAGRRRRSAPRFGRR